MILSTFKFCCKLTKIVQRGWVSANATMLMRLASGNISRNPFLSLDIISRDAPSRGT